MYIEIRLYHGLDRYLPKGEGEYGRRLDVPPETTAGQVLASLGVPVHKAMVLFIGGRVVGRNYVLKSGDVLTAMLPAGGGV